MSRCLLDRQAIGSFLLNSSHRDSHSNCYEVPTMNFVYVWYKFRSASIHNRSCLSDLYFFFGCNIKDGWNNFFEEKWQYIQIFSCARCHKYLNFVATFSMSINLYDGNRWMSCYLYERYLALLENLRSDIWHPLGM